MRGSIHVEPLSFSKVCFPERLAGIGFAFAATAMSALANDAYYKPEGIPILDFVMEDPQD